MPLQLTAPNTLPNSIADFVRKASSVINDREPDSIFHLKDDFQQLIADRAAWTELLNNYLEEVVRNKDADGMGYWLQNGIIVHYSQQFHLILKTYANPNSIFPKIERGKYIASAANNSLLGFYHDGEMLVDRYLIPKGIDLDVFQTGITLQPDQQLRLVSGDVLSLHARRHVIDFDLPEYGVAVVFSSAPCVSQAWTFDAKTLQSLGATIASEYVSVILQMIDELSRLRYNPAAEVISDLTYHPDHHVRWRAVKCLSKLDRDRALQRLHEAQNDTHPMICQAARSTLASATHLHAAP